MISFWSSIQNVKNATLSATSRSCIRITSPAIGASPTGIPYRIVKSESDRRRILHFLEMYFGSPPKTPVLSPRFSESDLILYVIDHKSDLCGSIRYSYTGDYESVPIYKIDCFCIHPDWRKKGLGSYLLSVLHKETNNRGLQFSIFLKESAPVFGASTYPFYSSMYVFRKRADISNTHTHLSGIRKLSPEMAYKVIQVYKSVFPDTFLLVNSQSTEWRLFHQEGYTLLLGCQDSFQSIQETHQSIGWITGWLESPVQPSNRSQIIDALLSTFSYSFFWADKNCVKEATGWYLDGSFHWYAYQWTPLLSPKQSYILSG